VQAEEHELAILLAGQPLLARAFSRRRLAPLDAVHGERTREELYATLRAWLAHHGSRKAIAHELGVHPQTVSYRMRNLHELFGSALDEPRARLELALALALELDPYSERVPAAVAEPALPA
jgi:DNA-binding PucR family transcriptional regulator